MVAGEDEPVELEKNVLVVANETVISGELLDRVRERAKKGPASFLIVSPQASDVRAPRPAGACAARSRELRPEGIDAHGQVVHPDPFTAAMEATHDERVDEIIVSTFPSARSGWLRRDLVERLRAETGVPVDHIVSEGGRRNERSRRAGRARARAAGREPPSAADPLQLADLPADRRDLPLHRLGDHALRLVLHRLLLRPRRERAVPPGPWPPYIPGTHDQYERPWFLALVNTFILVTSSFTMHWATTSIKRGHRAGLCAGMVLTLLLGSTFLLTQVIEYHRLGFNTGDTAFAATFFGLTGLHACHVFVGLMILLAMTIRSFRGHFSPRTTTGSRSAASTGTSST